MVDPFFNRGGETASVHDTGARSGQVDVTLRTQSLKNTKVVVYIQPSGKLNIVFAAMDQVLSDAMPWDTRTTLSN